MQPKSQGCSQMLSECREALRAAIDNSLAGLGRMVWLSGITRAVLPCLEGYLISSCVTLIHHHPLLADLAWTR